MSINSRIKEIEDMFPRKPGSRAIKHTLALIRGFWKLSSDYEVVDEFSGETISLPWKQPGNDSVIYVLNNIEYHVETKVYHVQQII